MIILLVEDDDMVRRAHSKMLRVHGHTAHDAVNGVEALKLMNTGLKPHIIISDLEMPGMGGDVLCVELRQRKSTIPFLLISGNDIVQAVWKVCGATDWGMKGRDLPQKFLEFIKKNEKLTVPEKKIE